MDIKQLLAFGVKNNASDLHLSAGMPPMIRVDGEMRKINMPELSHEDTLSLIEAIMDEDQLKNYRKYLETDFAFDIPGVARFRVNVFNQNRGAAGVFRTIPSKILTLEALDAPPILKKLSMLTRGLVLVTGPTGSGKSTTLAAMLDYKNSKEAGHILTVEDPIEFVHKSQMSLINQREVHRHTQSFDSALRSALREDPDTILVGEMRDLETIRLALTAAETGHLVLGTLHTTSAPKTVDRIIDAFPAEEQSMIRTMLSESIQGVVSQLLMKKEGGGRVAAHEILIGTRAIRSMIRENKIPQMKSTMQTSSSDGMQTIDQCLKELVLMGKISREEAAKKADDPESLHDMAMA